MILNPAETVIRALGGVCKTARLLNRDKSAISKWKASRDNGGTGGLVPSSLQKQILDIARAHGIYLTADELVYGREYQE